MRKKLSDEEKRLIKVAKDEGKVKICPVKFADFSWAMKESNKTIAITWGLHTLMDEMR